MKKFIWCLLVILFFPVAGFSDSNLTQEDLEFLEVLKEKGMVPKNTKAEDVPADKLQFFRIVVKERYGIEDLKTWKPDPRLSSPEKTWKLYTEALLDSDFDLAQKCHIPGEADRVKYFKSLGKEETKERLKQMSPMEQIYIKDKKAKYRIKVEYEWKGKLNYHTYRIHFLNIFGEWKMKRF